MRSKFTLVTIKLGCFYVILLSVFSISFFACMDNQDNRSPIEIANSVADKVIRESDFSFQLEEQKDVLGIHYIDFKQNLAYNEGAVAFAYTFLESPADTTISFGISSAGPTSIQVNGNDISEIAGQVPAQPVEESYNRFKFQKVISVALNKGNNSFLIKTGASNNDWIFFIRPVTESGDEEIRVSFTLKPLDIEESNRLWLCMGEFTDGFKKEYPPENGFRPYYDYLGNQYHWFFAKVNCLLTLNISRDNSYQRDSYLDWHYAHGATVWTFLDITQRSGDPKFKAFTQKYCDFITENLYYFQWQYFNLHAFRSSYHRIFRRTMLDDTGAPILPFAELFLQEKSLKYLKLINPIAKYVLDEQVRLDDGTLCRPEPGRWTVWADDLFMSVPFLVRMSVISGDQKYNNEAANQIIKFYQILFDEEKKLCYHGWFSADNRHSVAFWGRANGWMIWAVTEALLKIPESHPDYQQILNIYKKHIAGLVKYQGRNGLWHQVLDHPESFEETSCTAMFMLAIARGVRMSWLDKEYKKYLMVAWQGIKDKIGNDGTVHDICRGTGIGDNLEFYFNRKRFDHDPRGLGAVITAALEMEKLER